MKRFMSILVVVGITAAFGLIATPAGADPTGSKNATTGTANCGSAGSFQFVVNNSNGQGAGTNNNGNQAEFAPAHLSPGNGVFHPTVFDLTFTFIPVSGPSQSFTNTDSRKNQTGNVTCALSANQTDPAGDQFVLSGTVTGWIS